VRDLGHFNGSIIDSPQQVGGWPDFRITRRVFDEGADPNGDNDFDCYTNIEERLHKMAAEVEGR
jgi:hypothetical protein